MTRLLAPPGVAQGLPLAIVRVSVATYAVASTLTCTYPKDANGLL